MRVLAVNQFYAPDLAATSQLLGQLCLGLASAGDEVTVIASRGSYLGGGRLPARENMGGVEVIRPWATSLGKASVVHRLADYLSFFATSLARLMVVRRPEVVLVLTTPPMIASGVAAVCASRRVPLVTWVQDVYPDLAAAFGVLSPTQPLYRTLRAVARRTHRSATRIVALSEGMADRLADQGAPRERLRVIPNWADAQVLAPRPTSASRLRTELGLGDRFVVMYSGNMGVGHDVSTLVEAARLLEHTSPRIAFLFVGDGVRRPEAERLAADLSNVRFLGYQPAEALADSLTAADVHLASLREGLEGLLVPSKLYGVMAVGRPLFYVGPAGCELARMVRLHELGWNGLPGDALGLARALERAAADAPFVEACGLRARAAFLGEAERVVALRRFRAVLAEVVAGVPRTFGVAQNPA